MNRKLSGSGKLAWALVALLAVLHYDFWNWGDRSVVFGFLPVGPLLDVRRPRAADHERPGDGRAERDQRLEQQPDRPADDA